MLKRNSKAMAIVIAFCLCIAMVAPVFVAPDTAQAAATYRGLTTPTFGPSDNPVNLGVIEVDIPSGAEVASGDVLTLNFPSGVTANLERAALTSGTTASPDVATVIVPDIHPLTGQPNGLVGAVRIPVAAPNVSPSVELGGTHQSLNIIFRGGTFERGILYVYLNNMELNGASGDLTAQLAGSSSAFPMGTAVIGKISSNTGTVATMKSVKPIGTATAQLDIFTLIETHNNSLTTNEVIKIKLPVGFSWKTDARVAAKLIPAGDALVQHSWAFPGATGNVVTWTGNATINGDDRILDITVPVVAPNRTTAGRIDIAGSIKADDSIAKKGDVVAHVYSNLGNVTEQDITIATYGNYAANAVEGTVAELVAGKAEQKLGTFYIKEELPGSLVSNRTVKLTLPEGVVWWGGYRTGASNFPAVTVDQGDVALNNLRLC